MEVLTRIPFELIGAFPDSDPIAPPGLGDVFATIIGIGKWIGLGVAVVCMVVLGIMVMASRSGDGQRHVSRLGYIIGGIVVVMGAASLLAFLTGY